MGKPVALVGGVVAYNEERTIVGAVRSLLGQVLPANARWSQIWVVVSGCTDGTAERVRELAEDDPRVRLVEQPERRGKADALNTIFTRASGDLLTLLNGDSIAEPGSVRALLEAAADLRAPFAVMGRPVVPANSATSALGGAVEILWDVHEGIHRETLADGNGNHLCDELLLVSLPLLGPLPYGTINDGAFIGASLKRHGGILRYARDGRVGIQIPSTVEGYLTQRRRIYVGHARQTRATGEPPTTLLSLAFRQPRLAWRVVRRCWFSNSHRDRWAVLVSLEALAVGLALWDEIPPRRDQVRWRQVRRARGWRLGREPGSART